MNKTRFERARGRKACAPAAASAVSKFGQPLASGSKALAVASALVAIAVEFPSACQAQEASAASREQAAATLPAVVVNQPKTATPASRPRKARGGEIAPNRGTEATESSQEGAPDLGTGSASASPVFSLGGINLMGGTVISSEQTWTFQKPTLDQSASLAPGVSDGLVGGTRNERVLFVRGFDRWQVPLSIDGVRVYLPADNRLDYGRFLTGADISEVQIAKGYASVLDGPGGLGGAINLVTRRPSKEFEAEMEQTFTFENDGSYSGFRTSGYAGTKQKYWYLMAAGSILDSNGWKLSEDFKPVVSANEDGGWRNHSQVDDWRINVKAGITPNATDEYSISYIKQEGSKGAPLHVSDPASSLRYWDWPWWNIDSIYSHTTTHIGQSAYINTKLYYNTFDNGLFSYDDATLTTQTKNSAFRSYYQDVAYGGSVDAGADITNWDTLKGAFHYRRDQHVEWQDLYGPTACPTAWGRPCTEPKQESVEDTYSAALENTFHATSRIDLVTGGSYDWRLLSKAEDWTTDTVAKAIVAKPVNYKLADSDAWNWQSALIYRYSDEAKVYASVSHRTRFPTLFERFSSRFGSQTSNPDLAPEVSTNYEIGWAGKLFSRAQVSTAFFYSDVQDFIQSVAISGVYNGQPFTSNQSQNLGDGQFYGWEASADLPVTRTLSLGGNVTLIHRDISNPAPGKAFELTGVPDAKGIAYVKWSPIERLTLTPNVEMASTRWTSNTAGSLYYQIGAYAIANISAEYEVGPGATFQVTARNLTDENYSLTDGFPSQGRSFTAGMKVKF
jgi:iron complex outermembrane recepter protein